MALSERQFTAFVEKSHENDLTTLCFELRQTMLVHESTPILDARGRKTGRVNTISKPKFLAFRVTDKKVVDIVRDALTAPANDYRRVDPAYGMVNSLWNPASPAGKRIAEKGFTQDCSIIASGNGVIVEMPMKTFLAKLKLGHEVARVMGDWKDDPKRIIFRASGLKDGTEMQTADGIEFTDLSVDMA